MPETMLPSRPGAMVLPEVTLPLNTLQVNTAYSLLVTGERAKQEEEEEPDTATVHHRRVVVGSTPTWYQERFA
jgi:hypothetical protein